ncbi:MAG: hypothetical protein ACYDG3_00275 [Bacillati bacterium]
MRSRLYPLAIVCALLLGGIAASTSAAGATPSRALARIDAAARAEGNHIGVARRVGVALLRTRWSAQILKVRVDSAAGETVLGLLLSGEKFHRPLSRRTFAQEVVAIAERSFAAAPVSEVDVWVVIPIGVARGAIVSGDLAVPTSRTVFSVSVERGETPAHLLYRLLAGQSVYWNEEWAGVALKQRP